VRIVDTPGFGDHVNNEESVEQIIEYLLKKHYEYKVMSKGNDAGDLDLLAANDERVHVCLYFISAGR